MSTWASDSATLIEECQGLVRSLAARIHGKLPRHVELEDLVAYGQVGLAEAARDFDPTRGSRFSTFAYYRIRGAIYDGLAKMSWFSRVQYNQFRYERMAGEVLRHKAEESEQASPPDAAIAKETNQRLHELIDALPVDAGNLIRSTYFKGLGLQEAGRNLGISGSWASRLHAKTLERLARHLRLSGISG